MERRITEEKITKAIINWLVEKNWTIICFDFPQSGTGVSLHPNEIIKSTKNKKSIIPDIVAYKNNKIVIFENKDRFSFNDLIKVQDLRDTNLYSKSIEKLLQSFVYSKIFYGVGLPLTAASLKKILINKTMLDFAVSYEPDESILVKYDPLHVFV